MTLRVSVKTQHFSIVPKTNQTYIFTEVTEKIKLSNRKP